MLISNLIQIIVINFPDRLRAARGCLFLWFTEFTKLSWAEYTKLSDVVKSRREKERSHFSLTKIYFT